MRFSLLARLLAIGLSICQTAGSVCAQESPLVPPWGLDLYAEQPPASVNQKEPAPWMNEQALQRGQWRFIADYWLAWTKNDRIPVLLTTGPTTDLRPGALGQPFTRILYGDAVDYEDRHGGRFMLEAPLGTTGDWSLAASYLFLGS